MAGPKERKKKTVLKDETIRFLLAKAEKEAFNQAARREGRTLSNWLRWAAWRACGAATLRRPFATGPLALQRAEEVLENPP